MIVPDHERGVDTPAPPGREHERLTNAQAAQLIARKLGPIIPICYLVDGVCGCGGRYDVATATMVPHTGHDLGKAPVSKLVRNGVDDATTNSATIDMYWRHHPQAGVGLALKPAGKVFIDPDSPDALAEAEALGIDGGLRRESRNVGFLFNRQADCPSDVGITKSADHVELELQTFGYAVVWGTHANGSPVRVELDRPTQDTPSWAVDRLKAKSASKAEQSAVRASRRAARAEQGIVGDDPLWQLDGLAMDRWNGTLFEVDASGNLDRSRSLYHIGIELANHGATEAGIRWAVENRDGALGWNKYTNRDDADEQYEAIAEKVVADGIIRGKPRGRENPAHGADGEETCQGCTERDKTIASLSEHLKTYRAAEHLVRSGTVPAAEALVLEQLTKIRAYAQSKGDTTASLYVPEVARTAGVGDTTVTRAFNQLRRWQADPEMAALLPFKIEDHGEGRKSHLRLRVLPLPDEPAGERSRAAALIALGQMPRDEGRQKHGGERIACPHHPESAIVRTRQWRCTEDDCSWVQQDTARIEPKPDQDGPVRTSTMYGAKFFDEIRATSVPDQDGPLRYTDMPDQDGPGRAAPHTEGGPVSFVTRDMVEAAAGPRLRLVPDHLGPAPTVTRPKPWRCHCGSYERDLRPGGGYRCDGCAAVVLPPVAGVVR